MRIKERSLLLLLLLNSAKDRSFFNGIIVIKQFLI